MRSAMTLPRSPRRRAPAAPASSSRRRGRLLAKLALSLGVLVFLLLGLEAAIRTRQYFKYGTFGQVHEFVVDEATGLEAPPPGRKTERITLDSRGFRNPELAPPSDEVVRIAFLGASTTYCAEVSGDEATWPSLVTAGLNTRLAPARFDYVNASSPGWTVTESRTNLAIKVAPLEPDVIVIYHATNDLTRNSRRLAQAQGVYRGHSDQTSALGEVSLAWYLLEKNLLLRRRTRAARDNVGRLEVDVEALSQPFRRDLTALVEEAAKHAERVCLVTFSTQARRGQSEEALYAACVTSLYYMPYMTPEGLLSGFAAYNGVIREVAAEHDALLIEAELAVPGDSEHFNDSVHFKDAGARAMADAVLEALVADPAIRTLTAR